MGTFEHEVRAGKYSTDINGEYTAASKRRKTLHDQIVTNTTVDSSTCISGTGNGAWETKYNTDLKFCGATDLKNKVLAINDLSDYNFKYYKNFNKDDPSSGESSTAAWVWCDKRAKDNFETYFLEEAPGWMSKDQAQIKKVFSGVTTFGVVVVVAISVFFKLYNMWKFLFFGSFSPTGEPQGIDFVDCDDIQAYIPEWKQAGFEFPFVSCDMDAGHIHPDYLSYEVYDYTPQYLCRDAQQGEEAHYPDIVSLNKERSRRGKPIFSPMKMYVNEILESGVRSSDTENRGSSQAPVNPQTLRPSLTACLHSHSETDAGEADCTCSDTRNAPGSWFLVLRKQAGGPGLAFVHMHIIAQAVVT